MRQIAREQHVARKTVCKAIESAEAETYRLRKPRAAPILGPYKGRIDELLRENEHVPRKQRYTNHTICKEIRKDGYQGSESTVRAYVGQQRRRNGGARSTCRWSLTAILNFDGNPVSAIPP
jgi:hypothetical protein